MRQWSTSSRPLISISTMPPPATPEARRFFRSSESLLHLAADSCACFSKAPRLESPLNMVSLLEGSVSRFLDAERQAPKTPSPAGPWDAWQTSNSRWCGDTGRATASATAAGSSSSMNSRATRWPVTSANARSNCWICRWQTDLVTESPGLKETASRLGAWKVNAQNCLP